SRSSTARADNTDKSTGQQHTKLVQKSTVRIIGSLVRKTESDKVLLIGTPHPTPAKAAEFRRVDLASIGAATSASQRAGVRHLVYVSVAHPAPVMRAYIAARQEGEALVAASGIPATVLRPWYVLGPGHRWSYLLLPFYALLR